MTPARPHLHRHPDAGRRGRVGARLVLSLGAAGLLAACTTVGPDYRRPAVELPAAWRAGAGATTDAVAPAGTPWWTLYGDPVLVSLVDATLAGNADARTAMLRVDEAAAVLDETRAVLWPSIDANASVSRARSSTLSGQQVSSQGPIASTHRAVLSTSFEIDLWGRLRRISEAAQAQYLATRHARDTVQLALAGTTAQAYFALRALDAQLIVTQAEQVARHDSLRLIERRVQGGTSSALELAQARASRAAIDAQLPELRRQRAVVEHQLGSLVGKPGLEVAAGDLRAMPMPATPPAGLPSALLERRPDVQQAEQQLVAANAQVGVARAAMFPTLSLTGTFGGQSRELSDLFKSGARVWSIGPSVLFPLFDAGRLASRSEQARLQAEQAALAYQKAAESAFRETADALVGIEQGALQEAAVREQMAAAREALRVATRRYDAGYSGYLEVLDAQRTANDAELAWVRVRQTRLNTSVDLVKALGGGWSAETAASR